MKIGKKASTMFLPTNGEKNVDRLCDKRGRFKQDRFCKVTANNQKKGTIILRDLMKKKRHCAK